MGDRLPEWGSGGRWFESSRPDIVRPVGTTSSDWPFFMLGACSKLKGRVEGRVSEKRPLPAVNGQRPTRTFRSGLAARLGGSHHAFSEAVFPRVEAGLVRPARQASDLSRQGPGRGVSLLQGDYSPRARQ